MTRRRIPMTALAASLATILAACSIATDGGPRDIPEDERRTINPPEEAAAASAGETRIFLVAESDDGDGRVLHPVARDVDEAPARVLDVLLQGRNDEEQEQGIHTLLPEGLTLTPVPNFPQDELVIEASSALNELPGDTRMLAVGQIVTTMTSLESVDEVQLELEEVSTEDDEEPPLWPTSNGELVERPLTLYDYFGLLDTNQPAYPPAPSDLIDEAATTTNEPDQGGGRLTPD